MRRALPTVVLIFALAVGCRGAGPWTPAPRPPFPPAGPQPPPPQLLPNVPPGMYWEPVETPILETRSDAPMLPVSRAQLTRASGLEERWTAAPPELRDALVTRGFAVARTSRPGVRLGEFYASLRDSGIPWVVTVDTLFFLTHLAFDRALADVDADVISPLMAKMLHRLDVRLAADSRVANPDMGAPYVLARVLVGVALALAEPTYVAAPGIAGLVAAEKARVLAHSSVGVSPVLGVPIDYTAMSPVGMADRDGALSGWFRAASWLQNVGLCFEGAGERDVHGAKVDLATARMHTRTALILARLLDNDVDAAAASAWEGIERTGELVIGQAAVVTRWDLSSAATRADLDLRRSEWFANVVPVDRVRHVVARDNVGAPFFLLGPRAVPDGATLQSLTFPMVGQRLAAETPTADPAGPHGDLPATTRDGTRALPTGLDVAAWLGSGEARAALHESGDDAYERYEETLERLMRTSPSDAALAPVERHLTPYLTMIDAIETWLLPSRGDGVQPAAFTSEWRKRKVEVALAAWTELRHDATELTRIPLAQVKLPPRAPETITGPMFVEPHPEVIAKLAAFVRQTKRALVAEGGLRSGSPALVVLDELDDFLWMALGAAVYETADEPFPLLLDTALAGFPARIRALEVALEGAGVADVPLAVDVHVDISSGRVLEETTGRIEEMWMAMREPGTHVLWVALGASISHHELVQPVSRRSSDSAWRTRLQTEGDPSPGVLARTYTP